METSMNLSAILITELEALALAATIASGEELPEVENSRKAIEAIRLTERLNITSTGGATTITARDPHDLRLRLTLTGDMKSGYTARNGDYTIARISPAEVDPRWLQTTPLPVVLVYLTNLRRVEQDVVY